MQGKEKRARRKEAMTWIQVAGAGLLAAASTVLYIWGPEAAYTTSAGLASAAGVILAGAFAKRGPQ